ncbi:MAG: CdaR family protein [Chloroflexota bacterium]
MTQNRSPFITFLRENLGWMLGSLLLAVIVWYIASSAQNPVEQRRMPARLPIQVLTDTGLLVVNSNTLTTAQVTIRAPRSVWDVLEADDVSVVADLTKHQPGKYTIPLTATLSSARHGSIIDIQPSQITVEVARRGERLVTISAVQTADPPPGFTATSTLSESSARIVGSDADVNSVDKVLARINLQDQRVGFSRAVPLVAVDKDNKEVPNIVLTPSQVTVTVDIQTKPGDTELAVQPQLIGNLPDGYRRSNYSWEPQRVLVRGDRATIDAMNGIVVTNPIDMSGKTTTFTQRIKLELPSGVTLTDAATEITVTVEIEPVPGSREFDNIKVQPQGLDPADYAITVQPTTVNVIINGPQLVLDALTASDITVTAPLSGLSAGKFPITLQASVTKPGISSKDIIIPNAKVEVTIVALNPTITPTVGPTRTPTMPATEEVTVTP